MTDPPRCPRQSLLYFRAPSFRLTTRTAAGSVCYCRTPGSAPPKTLLICLCSCLLGRGCRDTHGFSVPPKWPPSGGGRPAPGPRDPGQETGPAVTHSGFFPLSGTRNAGCRAPSRTCRVWLQFLRSGGCCKHRRQAKQALTAPFDPHGEAETGSACVSLCCRCCVHGGRVASLRMTCFRSHVSTKCPGLLSPLDPRVSFIKSF